MPYDHRALLNEIDHYQNTVWAIVAFLHECRWSHSEKRLDASVRFGLGRQMRTESGIEVTPDLVLERPAKHGIAAEVKVTFPPPSEAKRRDDVFEQLQKYDTRLTGWWTSDEAISSHDVVLLTHFTKSVDASDHLATFLSTRQPFTRKVSIVGFGRHDQQQSYISLKKEYGELQDKAFSERLRKSVSIPIKYLEPQQKKFCDCDPPMAYLLFLLWQFVFPKYLDGLTRDPEKGYISVSVTTAQLTSDLQTYYGYPSDGPRNRGVPRSGCIENGLGALRNLKLAHVEDSADGSSRHVIHYKKLRGDSLERFGNLLYDLNSAKTRKRRKSKQLKLFEDIELGD